MLSHYPSVLKRDDDGFPTKLQLQTFKEQRKTRLQGLAQKDHKVFLGLSLSGLNCMFFFSFSNLTFTCICKISISFTLYLMWGMWLPLPTQLKTLLGFLLKLKSAAVI